MVNASNGMPSFFVSRMDADVAERAVFKARWRVFRGTSRLMMLLAADWML